MSKGWYALPAPDMAHPAGLWITLAEVLESRRSLVRDGRDVGC